MLELHAEPDGAAEGLVLEASVRKGMGSVATVLVQRGQSRDSSLPASLPRSARLLASILRVSPSHFFPRPPGRLRTGDHFVAGGTYGKVRAMQDEAHP